MTNTLRARDVAAVPMLTSYLAGGVATAVTGLPSLVSDELGPVAEWVWLAMLLGGPCLSLLGMWMLDRWSGAWLRIAGGLACTGALGSFGLATIARFGWSTLTAWIMLGLTASTAMIVAGEAISMRAAMAAARAMGDGPDDVGTVR